MPFREYIWENLLNFSIFSIAFLAIILYNSFQGKISREYVEYRSSYIREEAMRMLLEQVYLFFIYILFIELAIVIVVAVALFVALVVTMRKLDNEKNTSLPGR